MHAKTEVPYDTSLEPSNGASVIKIVAYGDTAGEAMELHIHAQ